MSAGSFGTQEHEKCPAPFFDEDFVDVNLEPRESLSLLSQLSRTQGIGTIQTSGTGE
jgi:hypothetical protein